MHPSVVSWNVYYLASGFKMKFSWNNSNVLFFLLFLSSVSDTTWLYVLIVFDLMIINKNCD